MLTDILNDPTWRAKTKQDNAEQLKKVIAGSPSGEDLIDDITRLTDPDA